MLRIVLFTALFQRGAFIKFDLHANSIHALECFV